MFFMPGDILGPEKQAFERHDRRRFLHNMNNIAAQKKAFEDAKYTQPVHLTFETILHVLVVRITSLPENSSKIKVSCHISLVTHVNVLHVS